MICPKCEGKTELVLPTAFEYVRRHGKLAKIPCYACAATGKVDDRHPQWAVLGEALKDARIARRETLRDFCERTGSNPLLRQSQEMGFSDPSGVEP